MGILLKDALLANYDAETLKEISGMNAGSPEELAKAAAEILLKPDVMADRMKFLHDQDLTFFEVACRGETSVAKANYASADRIRDLLYGFADPRTMRFTVPDDVVHVYREIKTEAFDEKRKKMSWLNDCIRLVPLFYGAVRVTDFCRLYRQNRERQEDDGEIILRLLPELKKSRPVRIHTAGGELVSDDIEQSGGLDKIRQLHKEYPVRFPTAAEIKNITADFYPSDSASYKKLKKALIRETGRDADYADAFLELIFVNMAAGCNYDDLVRLLNEDGMTVSDEMKRRLRPLMHEAWMDTRCLMFNGERPRKAAPHLSYLF
jgi:hypothetical protein